MDSVNTDTFSASGNAKLLLFGEHSVVHGFPAIGVQLNDCIRLFWQISNEPLIIEADGSYLDLMRQCYSYIFKTIADLTFSSAMSASRSLVSKDIPGGRLTVKSDIVSLGGFGSSAALCVALVRLASQYYFKKNGVMLSDERLWYIANCAEKYFHGNPSGADTGLSMFTGMQYLHQFEKEDSLCSLAPLCRQNLGKMGIYLIYGAVPRKRTCSESIAIISDGVKSKDSLYINSMYELGQITKVAYNLLSNPNKESNFLNTFAALVNNAQKVLSKMNLVTDDQQKMISSGIEMGAIGGKMSGGGGGGAFFLVCKSEEGAEYIRTELSILAAELSLPGDAYLRIIEI